MLNSMVDDELINVRDYKAIEMAFHRDLMNSCRKYINHLNLVSVIGTIETVKQETIELVRATSKPSFRDEHPVDENTTNFE